ncbi:MAG: hypothetical protein AB7F51_17095, partial [Pseudorhodoplanes sp.]
LAWGDRILLMVCGIVAIVAPTVSLLWVCGTGIAALFLLLNWLSPNFSFGRLVPGAAQKQLPAGE